jgi:hypothetical protein
MAFEVYPPVTAVSGDPASQTFPATAAGTYNLSTGLSIGVYEITTDTVQSSFTLGLADADGYKYTGTIRGGKGYISIGSAVTKIVIPSGLTYPLNINIRLGAYTQIAAPTSVSATYTQGAAATFTFTAPSGATNITAYFADGNATSFATTSSPKTSVTIATAVHNQPGVAKLVASDANGVTGIAVSVTTNNNCNLPITGGTASTYTSGGTSYLVNTFTASGTLNVNTVSNIDYLVVAGGGAGSCGGAGAGGMLTGTRTSAATGAFTVTVGAGGAGKSGNRGASGLRGNQGSNSSIAFASALTAIGGGGGGMITNVNTAYTTEQEGGSGGSGGGGANNYNSGGTGAGGAGTAGQGNNGGNGFGSAYTAWTRGAGGGGAGAVGGSMTSNGTVAGAGGNGSQSSISGTATYYAGGGGGATSGTTQIAGGLGGGGASTDVSGGISGTVNTGGGGGGRNGGQPAGYGINSSGGSGIVIVRVAI